MIRLREFRQLRPLLTNGISGYIDRFKSHKIQIATCQDAKRRMVNVRRSVPLCPESLPCVDFTFARQKTMQSEAANPKELIMREKEDKHSTGSMRIAHFPIRGVWV